MRDDQWLEAYNAGRAEAEGLVEELAELVRRAQLNVPEFYVNWHHDARTALAKYREGRS